MKKFVIPIIAVILILVLALAILPAPESERCAICDSIPFHAPALVNLETGEVGELEVYEPHLFKVAELNEYQQGGTFSFIHATGLLDLKDPGKPVAFEIHIDMNHAFRCYEIKATTTETEEDLEIIVCGTLYA